MLLAELLGADKEFHSEKSLYDEIPLAAVDMGEKAQDMTSTLNLYLLERLVFPVLGRAWNM